MNYLNRPRLKSLYPKVSFRVFDKFENWNSKFYTEILFLPQHEKWNSNNWLLFSCLKFFWFAFLMLLFVLLAIVYGKWNTVFRLNFSFNYRLILTLWLFSQVWSTRYSKASLCQVPWDFSLYNRHADTKN